MNLLKSFAAVALIGLLSLSANAQRGGDEFGPGDGAIGTIDELPSDGERGDWGRGPGRGPGHDDGRWDDGRGDWGRGPGRGPGHDDGRWDDGRGDWGRGPAMCTVSYKKCDFQIGGACVKWNSKAEQVPRRHAHNACEEARYRWGKIKNCTVTCQRPGRP